MFLQTRKKVNESAVYVVLHFEPFQGYESNKISTSVRFTLLSSKSSLGWEQTNLEIRAKVIDSAKLFAIKRPKSFEKRRNNRMQIKTSINNESCKYWHRKRIKKKLAHDKQGD